MSSLRVSLEGSMALDGREESSATAASGADGESGARFEALLDRAERVRGNALGFGELRELGHLYRLHAASLARERTRPDDPERLRHLNALCLRAHTLLAVSAPTSHSLTRLFGARLASALGRTWRAQVAAWALLLLGGALGAALSSNDEAALTALIPASMGYSPERIDRLATSEAARLQFLEGRETPTGANALFGSFLFVNNTRVGFLSFATGILAGVPTVLLQLYNGMMLGAFASLFLRGASAVPFLAWILPHGIPELTAITWCAAGGLMLGQAVAVPLRKRRTEALRQALDSAVVMVAGAVPLFAVAALIESFVRESSLGTMTRFLIAALLFAALSGLMLWVRRLSRRVVVDTGWLREIGG